MTAREVCESTGLTMNQLRNWRLPSRIDKAPFGYVAIGTSPYYRKASVQKWLDRNQGSNVKYVPAGTDLETPIEDAYAGDAKRAMGMRMLGSITPENVYATRERFMTKSREITYDYATKRERQFIKEIVGDYDPMTRPINFETRFSEPTWFTASVKAMRLAQNEIAGLGFSEEEILALPIGQVPPLRETK